MSAPVVFLVEGPPRSKGSKSIGYTRTGQAFIRESGGAPLRKWMKDLKAAAKEAMDGRPPLHGPVNVVLTFALRWPQSHRGRQTWPMAKSGGDVDKLQRAVLDAITGLVIVDDCLVQQITARKVWGIRDVDWTEGVHVWVNHVTGFQPDRDALTSSH